MIGACLGDRHGVEHLSQRLDAFDVGPPGRIERRRGRCGGLLNHAQLLSLLRGHSEKFPGLAILVWALHPVDLRQPAAGRE